MREIKFRARRTDNGEWVFGGYSYCEKDNTHYITVMGKDHISHIGFHQQVNPETIGQFTGLKDINGKEIYEGDIVKSYSQYKYVNGIKTIFTEPRLVKFEFNRWYPFADDDYEYGNWWQKLTERCEVIGNIYENKELLGE